MDKKVIIFGAGIAGLSCARSLADNGYRVEVFEREEQIGGICRSFHTDFYNDISIHFIPRDFAQSAGISKECVDVFFDQYIYLDGKFVRFPTGLMKEPKYVIPILTGYAGKLLGIYRNDRYRNAEEYGLTYYGRMIYNNILRPLIRKWCGYDGKRISAEWASYRLGLPSLWEAIKNFGLPKVNFHYSVEWVYPRKGIQYLAEFLADNRNIKVSLRSEIDKVYVVDGRVTAVSVKGRKETADAFVSTMPVNRLSEMIDGTDKKMADLAGLQYRGLICVFLRFDCEQITRGTLTFFADPKYHFYRISELKNSYPIVAPPNETALCVEIGADINGKMWAMNDTAIRDLVIDELKDIYNISGSRLLGCFIYRNKYAYPVYLTDYEDVRKRIDYTTSFTNLFMAGRTGMFRYALVPQSNQMGVECAEVLMDRLQE